MKYVGDALLYGFTACVDCCNTQETWIELCGALTKSHASWRVDCLDCREDTLREGTYSAEALMDCLKQDNYIIFARLLGYAGAADEQGINTLEDFMAGNSACAVFCSDGSCFEVYAKRQDVAEAAHAALLRSGAGDLEYIDETNYGRTRFWVY